VASIRKNENPRKPYTVAYRDADRKQRERSFRTKREAQDFKVKLEHDSREGVFADPRAVIERKDPQVF